MIVEARPSILVVEDENIVAMDLVASLEKLNYPVAGVAASGNEAIELAQHKAPGLVLMDIHLRGNMDGIQAAREIQDKLFIPVVYLTAYSDQATLARARVTHPFGYLLKPFEDREVEVAIQIALFRHEMESALRASERRLHTILGNIGDAVIATDNDRRITFINPAAEALLGWKPERAQGRLLSDVLKTSSQGAGLQTLTRGRDTIPVEIIESPALDTAGKPGGYVTVARDLSERIRAQKARERELIERGAREAAEKERERARLKSEVSLILADFTQPLDMPIALRRFADLLIPYMADCCVLHIDDQDDPLRIVVHEDSNKLSWAEELQRRWLPDHGASRGPYAVMRTGQAEIVESMSDKVIAQVAGDPEHLDVLREAGAKAYLCVPLRARQRVFGSLTLISTNENQRFQQEDLSFAQELADRAAMAIDNVRLFREAQEAKARAEQLYGGEQKARAEAETLFRIADAITETQLDLDAVVQRVTDEATTVVGAKFGAFFYNVVNDAGESYMLYTLSGAQREAFEKLGLPRNTPVFAPTFGGHGVVRLDDVLKDPRYGKMAPHHGMPQGHLPVRSYLAVSVVSRTSGVIGGLFFGHPEPGQFTEQHERMVKALAAHAAVAIDNARLFRATRDSEKKLNRLVGELERAVRFSEMFVGILGHDLRNPLSAITTAASLILIHAEPERVANPITRILNSANRMSRMIDQILDFTQARIGRGIPLRRKRMDLGHVCRLVIDELKGAAGEATEVELDVRGEAVGEWDEDRLSQLLSNLTGNALQHRQSGTLVAVIIDGSHANRVKVEIQNQGVIAPEIVAVIFEPFRGGPDKKGVGSSGLGLGLYISQQIVLAHGGSICVESDFAQGTRFIVDLPRFPPVDASEVFSAERADS